jgi:hypothetical protein
MWHQHYHDVAGSLIFGNRGAFTHRGEPATPSFHRPMHQTTAAIAISSQSEQRSGGADQSATIVVGTSTTQ